MLVLLSSGKEFGREELMILIYPTPELNLLWIGNLFLFTLQLQVDVRPSWRSICIRTALFILVLRRQILKERNSCVLFKKSKSVCIIVESPQNYKTTKL